MNPSTAPDPRNQTGGYSLPSTTRIEAVETPISATPAPPPVYSGGTDEFVAVPSTVSIANLGVIATPTVPTEPSPKSGTADFVAVPANAVLSPAQKSGTADFVAVPTNESIQPNTEAATSLEVPPAEAQKVVPPSPPVEAQKAVVPPPPPPQAIRGGTSASPSGPVPVLAESVASPQSIPPNPAPFATFPQTASSSPMAEPAQPVQQPHLAQPIQPVASPQAVPFSTAPQPMPSSFSPQPAFAQPITPLSPVGGAQEADIPLPSPVGNAQEADVPPMRDFGAMEPERPEMWAADEPDEWESTSSKPSRLPLILGGASVVLLVVGALWMGLFSSNTPPVSRKDPAPRAQTKADELPLARGVGGATAPRAVAALSPEKKGQASDAKPLLSDTKDQASDAKPPVRKEDDRSSEPKEPSDRQAAPAPLRRAEEDAPAERRGVASAPEPEPRLSPRPRMRRVVSRVRRPAVRKARSRSSGCPVVAGMRALRLRSVGIPLRKVMIRVQGAVVTPDAQGCIQIPASVDMVMLAYQPDVTAYHLCQMKLSTKRSTLRFALVDANVAPPADGGCSK